AAVAASAAVVAIIVGVAAPVRDALVALAVLVGAAANGVSLVADLVLAAARVAAAAVVAVVVDPGLAAVVGVAVAVRPARMAGGDVAGPVAAGGAGVFGRAVVAAGPAVAVVVVGVDAGAIAGGLSRQAGTDADAAAARLPVAAGLAAGPAIVPVALEPDAEVAAGAVSVVADDVARDPAVLRRFTGIGIGAAPARGGSRCPRRHRARTTTNGKECQSGACGREC